MSGSAKGILRIFSAFFATNKLSTYTGLKHEDTDVIFNTAQIPLLLLYLRLPLQSLTSDSGAITTFFLSKFD